MRFGSVCSGIEAASVACERFSIPAEAAWFSEIEPAPCKLLSHHYPEVPNLGDMTMIPDMIRSDAIEAPDILVGGTPCQAFSVAGKRLGLEDLRGNLTLTFAEILDAIDAVRLVRGLRGAVCAWENVPGVLSSKDNAFGCLLGRLAGFDDALVCADGKWRKSGLVIGPRRRVAWCVLDAQYFGVAQRRRRVWVVAVPTEIVKRDPSKCPSKILTLGACLRGNTPTRTEAGQSAAGSTPQCVGATGEVRHTLVVAETYAIQGSMIGRNDCAGPQGSGINKMVQFTLNTTDRHGVAEICTQVNRDGSDVFNTLTKNGANGAQRMPDKGNFGAVIDRSLVRRLTPEECELLQGFPLGYTASMKSDSHRYKALGNSWAVPQAAWVIGRLVAAMEET